MPTRQELSKQMASRIQMAEKQLDIERILLLITASISDSDLEYISREVVEKIMRHGIVE